MTHTYYISPSIARGDFDKQHGGIRGSLEAHARLLPEYGWEEVHSEDEADIVVGYLSTKPRRLDVFHLRGLYPTAEIQMGHNFWKSNGEIIENLRRACHVVCVSEWVADILRRDMHMQPHVVPGHGIDLSVWDSVGRYVRSDSRPYALWNKTRSHGVCDPQPVMELASRFPDYQFITTFLPRGAQKLDNVLVTGLLPYAQAWPFVQGTHIYLATTKETFGRGTLEAMASGCAIVGFDWGATSDVLGGCGILVLPNDYDALAEAFEEAIHKGYQWGKDARRRVDEYFQWKDIVGQTAAIYDEALHTLAHSGPKVSIVIPVHNYELYVPYAIRSVCAQTLSDWELIVVDDGSTDDSVAVIEDAIANEPRARLIVQENAGVAYARNTGIESAQGQYICCVDADDAIAPTFLETLVPGLDADPKLGIVYTGIKIMYEDGGAKESLNKWPKQYSRERGLRGNQIPTCCLFRRSWWERLGGYRQRFAPYGAGQEDSDFWLRILASGGGAKKATDKGLFYYRHHPKQTTRVHRDYWTKDRYPAWYPWFLEGGHPIASQLAVPPDGSWAVRNYDCPEVGVVVPVGPDHAHLIEDALDSVEAQTLRNWELVVVNDTGDELDLTPWPYAKLINTEGRKGPAYSRNRGTEVLRAPLVVYLDADDWLQPDALRTFVEVQRETGNWVYSDFYVMRSNGELEQYKSPDWSIGALWGKGIALVTACYPVEMWKEVDGFDEGTLKEDFDFHLRLASAGSCGVRVEALLFTYRHATGGRRNRGSGDERKRQATSIRERYPKEELMRECAGCTGRSTRTRRRRASPLQGEVAVAKADWEVLEFIGSNPNVLMFRGIVTGNRYRAGNDVHHRFVSVHPDDVANFLRFPYFRMASRPVAKSVLEAHPNPGRRPPRKQAVMKKVVREDKGNGRLDKMTVREIQALKLSGAEWKALLSQEYEREKPRSTVVTHIKRRIRVAARAEA